MSNVGFESVDEREAACHVARDFVCGQSKLKPRTAIILGSGLGGIANQIDVEVEIPFKEIPGFGYSTASGHRGQLICGTLDDHPVVAMAGRLHRYEGWTNEDVTFPVRVMSALGAKRLIVSNAAGGVNPRLCVGDIVVIRDHINLMFGQWLATGSAVEQPARSNQVYDEQLSRVAIAVATRNNFTAIEGTYLGTLGPTFETRAEYRMMRRIGADVAGMSTIPEVLTATRIGMRVLGLSMVSNVASPDVAVAANHEEVLAAGKLAGPRMEKIVREVTLDWDR